MPLTPEDVRNKQFTTVRLREGYDEDEVDAFLDEVEGELTRLLRENEDLRAKLAAATRAAAQNQANMRKEPPQDARSGAPVPAAISGPPVPGQQGPGPQQQQMGPGGPQQQQMGGPQQQMGNQPLGLPSGAPQLPAGPQQMGGPQQQQMNQTMGGQQQLVQPMGGQMLQPMGGPGGPQQMGNPMGQGMGQQQQMQPMGGPMGGPQQQQMGGPMGAPMQQQGPGGDSAARVLALAQQTADQAISEARSEANKIVGEARSRAEGLERDARAKADALERDAQEKHRVAMGSLESARATLERKVEDLRAFEREYRTRLKSYLETQLRQLESQADDSLAPPRIPATASLPPAASSMAPAGAGAMSGAPAFGGNQPAFGGNAPSFGGQSSFGGNPPAPSFGGQASGGNTGAPQMQPAGMTQPMAAVRPQPPQPMQQAPAPMRGFLIDEDGDN
ncbi:DivIVA domain-containing protein [Kitasatospora sp. NPDC088264]|uniref:DivIVA domain-containing protein n=1 Tax=Kitasatospora sp. NPDC088264 TaxID=3155296 RepID=UPI00341384E1